MFQWAVNLWRVIFPKSEESRYQLSNKREYAFPGMSRLATSLTTKSPYYRAKKPREVPGTVRVIFKCDEIMSDNEAQQVLDDSRV